MHRTIKKFFLILLITLAFFVNSETGKSDKELKELLVGSWLVFVQNEMFRLEGTSSYENHGVMSFGGSLTIGDDKKSFKGSATWTIEDGKLTTEVLSSNMPSVLPKGEKSEDLIISLNEKEFVYTDKYGVTMKETRSE